MMIPYSQFGALRLRSFLPGKAVVDLVDWEFEGRTWVGEAVGFSEWLRLDGEPEILRSLSLDFTNLPDSATQEVLRVINLPVRPGMTAEALTDLLGKPSKVLRFVADRATYEFVLRKPHRYNASCTILHDGGLSYLVVMAPLPRTKK